MEGEWQKKKEGEREKIEEYKKEKEGNDGIEKLEREEVKEEPVEPPPEWKEEQQRVLEIETIYLNIFFCIKSSLSRFFDLFFSFLFF